MSWYNGFEERVSVIIIIIIIIIIIPWRDKEKIKKQGSLFYDQDANPVPSEKIVCVPYHHTHTHKHTHSAVFYE